MIKCKNISKKYKNGIKALDNINLSIDKSEFVYLIGPSGSGKSTLLKLIFRAELPTEGDITIDNLALNTLKNKQIPILRRHIGMIFQDYKLLPKRNVYENVAFALAIMHVEKKVLKKQVDHVLELVGLQDKRKAFPYELSGGEQQKLCIARAIANNPLILLCDEPTGNLDPDTSWEIVQLLSRINERQTTVLMATHNMDIVDGIPKRVIALEEGQIVRDQQFGAYN